MSSLKETRKQPSGTTTTRSRPRLAPPTSKMWPLLPSLQSSGARRGDPQPPRRLRLHACLFNRRCRRCSGSSVAARVPRLLHPPPPAMQLPTCRWCGFPSQVLCLYLQTAANGMQLQPTACSRSSASTRLATGRCNRRPRLLRGPASTMWHSSCSSGPGPAQLPEMEEALVAAWDCRPVSPLLTTLIMHERQILAAVQVHNAGSPEQANCPALLLHSHSRLLKCAIDR
jgi:hypothetical protein